MNQSMDSRVIESQRFFPFWDSDNPNSVLGLIELCFDAYHHNPNPQTWVEIGCFLGESTTIFSGFPFVKRIYSVDPFEQPHPTVLEHAVERVNRIKKATLIKKTSYMYSKTVYDKTIDVVYIDGSHQFESVKEDLNIWNSKLKNNGLLCGHDYSKNTKWDGVVKAVDEFMSEHPKYSIKTYCDTSFMIKKCI